jgi:hypothetical protein
MSKGASEETMLAVTTTSLPHGPAPSVGSAEGSQEGERPVLTTGPAAHRYVSYVRVSDIISEECRLPI